MANLDEIKKRLTDERGEFCYICGAKENLQIEHLLSKSRGGTDDIENLALICARCHSLSADRTIREFEFSQYLANLISLNKEFKDVQVEKQLEDGRIRVDIATKETTTGKDIYIELKVLTFLDSKRVSDVIAQINTYKPYSKNGKLVFSFIGILPEKHTSIFKKENIEVWDIDFIASKFKNEILKVKHPFFQQLFGFRSSKDKQKSREEILIERLKNTKAGKSDWSLYQKLLHEILENIFCPPLSIPIYELPDEPKINRRDIIMPNYTENGFWAYLRVMYGADFVVIDAKNYSKKVQKRDVLQMANYLKQYGAGLFGIIISRNGEDNSSFLTRREAWAIQKKLIIVLGDEDIMQMLLLKLAGNNPEDVLKQKIEEFRLSL